MSYYYWHSTKMAQDIVDKPAAKAAGDVGYGICVDGQNKCFQYMMITQQSTDDKQRAGGYADLHIVATGRERDDVQILLSPTGKLNEKLAQELGFDTELPKEDLVPKIIAKTENFTSTTFRSDKPTMVAQPQIKPMRR